MLHDLPGIGENPQDHSEVYTQYACQEPITLNGKMGLFIRALIGMQWLPFKESVPLRHSNGRTSSIASCPRPCATMAKSRSTATASDADIGSAAARV